jgi:glucose-6-phosphate isomerase
MASNRKSLLNPMMKQRARLADKPMRLLFAEDKNRFKTFTASAGDILLDYSKNRIDQKAMDLLFDIARKAGVEDRRKAMWAGQHINVSEDRAVMHMALRYMGDKPVKVDGRDVMPDVRAVHAAK